MAARKKFPVYLFYGNQTEPILRARDEVLASLMPDEERGKNLTEYMPQPNRYGTDLTKILPDLAGDLGTVSFIAGTAKVAVVTNPSEIYGATFAKAKSKSKKAAKPDEEGESAAQRNLLKWFEKVLPDSGNHVILLAFEDESEEREVNESHALVQLVMQMGIHQRFRDNKAFFRIEDAIAGRRLDECLHAVRDLWKPGKGDMKVYSAVTRSIRYLIQANIGRERQLAGDAQKQAILMPANPSLSLFKASPYTQRKYVDVPPRYRTSDLLKAHQQMLEVYKALRPQAGEVYVADAQAILEQTLVELLTSPGPHRR